MYGIVFSFFSLWYLKWDSVEVAWTAGANPAFPLEPLSWDSGAAGVVFTAHYRPYPGRGAGIV